MSLARQVVERWREDGVDWDGGGADARLLDEVERVHEVRLPACFRELWTLCDGTGASDRHGFIFMQASDLVQPLYAPREAETVRLVFADWRLGTAVSLQLAPDDHGVMMVDNELRHVAPSFEAFLEMYLRRSGFMLGAG